MTMFTPVHLLFTKVHGIMDSKCTHVNDFFPKTTIPIPMHENLFLAFQSVIVFITTLQSEVLVIFMAFSLNVID